MKEEKESKKEIVILDEGIEPDALIRPTFVCCGSIFMPIRAF
jgi:hypothetical protein